MPPPAGCCPQICTHPLPVVASIHLAQPVSYTGVQHVIAGAQNRMSIEELCLRLARHPCMRISDGLVSHCMPPTEFCARWVAAAVPTHCMPPTEFCARWVAAAVPTHAQRHHGVVLPLEPGAVSPQGGAQRSAAWRACHGRCWHPPATQRRQGPVDPSFLLCLHYLLPAFA
jgi:hypothetical protein